jgi:ABC-type transporter Mla MlaB component
LALSFLYTIRCSLHGAAVRKNVSNLKRTVTGTEEVSSPSPSASTMDLMAGVPLPLAVPDDHHSHRRRLSEWTTHRRRFSEVVDMDWSARRLSGLAGGGAGEDDSEAGEHVEAVKTHVVFAKPTHYNLKQILANYAYSQFCCGFVGSFAVVPSVAASSTMYSLGAGHVAPQIFSCIFVLILSLFDFSFVSYIPKPAFSSLLVLAVIDMFDVWFIKAYYKTREKEEWLVVPAIVILSFLVGLLGAVFLGIAMSTFLFVASFFRTGVVKYIANGITIRSTIERPPTTASWLDENGDLIQVLVLQNYLFFGNASSTLDYISSMFEQLSEDDVVPYNGMLPPIPKIIILDLTLVTGMDTSAVDVFSGILNLCKKEDCRLFISGVASSVRQVMELSGFKPETTTVVRSKRKLRFFSDLDTAVGKAEDLLLHLNSVEDKQIRRPAGSGGGFNNALDQIAEQLQINCYDLIGLKEHTREVNMESGQVLYRDIELERGLFFIECGIIKLERDTESTLTRLTTINALTGLLRQHNGSLNAKRARSTTIARELARLKAGGGAVEARNRPTFRIARVGPGWILGAEEVLTGEVAEDPSKIIAGKILHV